MTCAAKASFSSMTSISSMRSPVRASTLRVAGMGPRPMYAGSTPATAEAMTRAIGRRPSSSAVSAEASSTAAAPSLMPEELPAVTVPSVRNTGRSWASFSGVVSGRGCSSRSMTVGSPFGCGITTGTISSLKRPSAMAREAR